MATVLQVIDSARAYLKDPLDASRSFPDDSSTFFKDSDLLDWYNYTQREVQNKLLQSFENWFVTSTSITIVSGQAEYSMPSDVLKVVRVEDQENSSSPVEVSPITLNEKDNYSNLLSANDTDLGSVWNYAIKGNSFIFRPIPQTSTANKIKVFYSKRLPDYSSASSISELPLEYHELLVWGTVKRGLILQESTPEAMAVANGEWNRLMLAMSTTSEDRQIQRPRFVKRRKYRR